MTTKTLSCPLPENLNPLSPNGFMFSVERIPEVQYFCQTVDLPEISFANNTIATPFVDYPLPGEKLQFGNLNVEFLVDSTFANYTALFNWMQGLGFPESWDQYRAEVAKDKFPVRSEPALSDASLSILNASNNTAKVITFKDCFPINLGSITFTSNTQDVQYIVGKATFLYSTYSLA